MYQHGMRNGFIYLMAYGDWFGDLSTIEYGRGYWLNMKEDANLVVHGKIVSEFNAELGKGWNLIGWPSMDSVQLPDAVSSIDGSYTDIATWNNRWEYRSYAYGDWFGDLAKMEPGRGYWVYADNQCTLSVS